MRIISWTAAILAGGRARRLGGADKSALLVGARSILDAQLSLLRGLTPHILIVSGDNGRAWPDDVAVVTDRVPGVGSIGGLYTALMEVHTEQVLVLACDMPFVTAPFLRCVVERGRDADAAVPRDAQGRLHPLCASYARRTAPHFGRRIEAGYLRITDALEALAVQEIGAEDLARFDGDGRLLLNINTPDDHARACQLLAGNDGSTCRPA